MKNNLLAQGITNPLLNNDLKNLSGVSYIQKLVTALVSLAFIAGVLLFFFMLVTGAIQWIASSGDKANIESARGKIVNAVVGLVLLFAAIAIVKVIETFFHIDLLKIDLGPLQIT